MHPISKKGKREREINRWEKITAFFKGSIQTLITLSKSFLTDIQRDNLKINIALLITSVLHFQLFSQTLFSLRREMSYILTVFIFVRYTSRTLAKESDLRNANQGLGWGSAGEGLSCMHKTPGSILNSKTAWQNMKHSKISHLICITRGCLCYKNDFRNIINS